MFKSVELKGDEKQLIFYYRRLNFDGRADLHNYASFLLNRSEYCLKAIKFVPHDTYKK